MRARRFFLWFVSCLLWAATSPLLAQTDEEATIFLPLISKQGVDGTAGADDYPPTDQHSELLCNAAAPIASIGHGVLFDTDGNEILVTPAFIQAAQKCYLDTLLQQANENQRTLFAQKQSKLFDGQRWDLRSELYASLTLLEWFVREVKPPDADTLSGKLILLRQTLTFIDFQIALPATGDDATPFELPAALQELLVQAGLTGNGGDDISASSTTWGGDAYIKGCRAAGVPIPPDWGTAGWKSQGPLTINFLKSRTTPDAEVYTYESKAPDSEGMCFALPRSKGSTIELLGIICLGKTSSNACFWDNQENGIRSFRIRKGEVVRLSRFAGGAALNENVGGECTDCHAGENPFIIHPETNLGLPKLNGLPLRADNWYRPLVKPSWSQNIGPTNLLDSIDSPGKCTACHTQTGSGGRFPRVSTETPLYCKTILPQAFARTMPPKPFNPKDSNFAKHVNALKEACKQPPDGGLVPCNEAIFVDNAYTGHQLGTAARPFHTVSAAYAHACDGAQLRLKAGVYPERLTLAKKITIRAENGTVTIGN